MAPRRKRVGVVDAFRRAIRKRRTQMEFYDRGEAAWQQYQRTGVSRPCDEVFDRIQARIDDKRREIARRVTPIADDAN